MEIERMNMQKFLIVIAVITAFHGRVAGVEQVVNLPANYATSDKCPVQDQRVSRQATYYVDANSGNNSQSGLSPGEAWETLYNLNKTVFKPGDRILLRSGSSWEGQLELKGSGTAGMPIVIDRYGDGAMPEIHGNGGKDYTLLLENVEYWEVNNLEITNQGKSRRGGRRGVIVRAINMGDCRRIHLKNLVIHNVNGSLVKAEKQGGSAILIQNHGQDIPTRFVDLLIEGCHLYRCERNGINFRGNTHRNAWHPSLNVVIRKNLLEEIPGDGIVPVGCDGAVVEHNVMRNCPDTLPFGQAAAGIWPWSSDNTIIQFNEVSGHNAKWDGQGFDADFNCIGTVIQYNYSHDNAGGFLLVCNNGNTFGTSNNIGTENTIVRYNVSINDGIREYPTRENGWFTPVFHISGPVKNTRIYNNLIILPKKKMQKIDSAIVQFGNWGGPWPKGTSFANNIFIADNSSGFHSARDEGTQFTNNCYFGQFENLPKDTAPLFADPKLLDAEARGEGFEVLKNFMLQAGSPCIGAGIPVAQAIVDLFGHSVPESGPVSIGIQEHPVTCK